VSFARWRLCSSAYAVRKTTGVPNSSRTRAAAATPSIGPLSIMSMSTRSGRWAAIFASATSPVAAMAGTS
jgi:hypothetical protein